MYDGKYAFLLKIILDQKKRASRISTETRSSVPSGQFLLWNEEWGLANILSLVY